MRDISTHSHISNWYYLSFSHRSKAGVDGARVKDQSALITQTRTAQTAMNMLTRLTKLFLKRFDRSKSLKIAVKKCAMIRHAKIALAFTLSSPAV